MEKRTVQEKGKGTRKRRIWLRSLLTAILCLALAFPAPVSASAKKTTSTKTTSTAKKKKAVAKKRKKAIAAYKKLLAEGYSENTTIKKFLLLDIDKNGVPELIILVRWEQDEIAWELSSYMIFSYSNGKVNRIYSTSYSPRLYYYSVRKVICIEQYLYIHVGNAFNGNAVDYYKMSGSTGELKNLATMIHREADNEYKHGKYQYEVGGKTVSKSRYTSYVKKITKNSKRIDLTKKMKDNTAANRNKYLK